MRIIPFESTLSPSVSNSLHSGSSDVLALFFLGSSATIFFDSVFSNARCLLYQFLIARFYIVIVEAS